MRRTTLLVLAQREACDALRNRWFVAYAAAFVVLTAALALLVRSSASYGGVSGFGRTAASLVNLVVFLAPLMGLTLGAQALTGERERGTLGYLLTQPISTAEFFASKFIGLGLALTSVVMVGFGLSALLMVMTGSRQGAAAFVTLTLLTVLLAWASLSIGYLISSCNRRTASALGIAMVMWIVLVFLGDLGLMGTAIAIRIPPGSLLTLTLLNPLESYRIAALGLLSGSFELLGPAGLVAQLRLGGWIDPILVGILIIWSLAPLTFAYRALARGVRQ